MSDMGLSNGGLVLLNESSTGSIAVFWHWCLLISLSSLWLLCLYNHQCRLFIKHKLERDNTYAS